MLTCASFSTEWFNHQLVVLLNLATQKNIGIFRGMSLFVRISVASFSRNLRNRCRQKWPRTNPPTAHPANGGGGSDSESEEEPPMKGMMQGAQFFSSMPMVGLVTGLDKNEGKENYMQKG